MKLTNILWSTRGQNWGFRLLLLPELDCSDWLDARHSMFREGKSAEEYFFNQGDIRLSSNLTVPYLAFSFPDPEQRKDRAGRIIPHEVALFGEETKAFQDIQSAVDEIWKILSSNYAILYPLSAIEIDKLSVEVTGDSLYIAQKNTEINTPLAEDNNPDFQHAAIAIGVIAIVAIFLLLSLQYLGQDRNPASSPESTNSEIFQITGRLAFSD